MITKKQLATYFEKSKKEIEAIIDSSSIRVCGLKCLRSFIKDSGILNLILGIPLVTADDLISLLVRKSHLKKVKFLTPRIETLYLWRSPNEYELMPALRPKGYYTHLSAMYYHKLIDYEPQSLYFNYEQPARPRTGGDLEQQRIDNAFKKKQRITTSKTEYYGREYWLLNGKQTGNYGVVSIKKTDNIEVQVTNLERTLIDITVRPAYAGGVRSVLQAYRLAQRKVSISKLVSTLRALDYIYPYHQSIGFYMDIAGNYSKENLEEFLKFRALDHNFYLDYGMESPVYSNQWKIYYPKDLVP